MTSIFGFSSAFLASAVEMVEALTIVLAAGVARGWRSALAGAGAALLALAVVVAALGPAITAIPLNALRLVVGGLLLSFGLQWLRKAILRASGHKSLHDEDAIFDRSSTRRGRSRARDATASTAYGFTLSFKGVFLEGLEVAFIVLTFGSAQRSIPLAALGADRSFRARRRRRSRAACAARARARERDQVRCRDHAHDVRDLLVDGGRGRGLARDRISALLALLAFVGAISAVFVAVLSPRGSRSAGMTRLKAFGRFWWDFVVGDDWISAVCIVAAIAAHGGCCRDRRPGLVADALGGGRDALSDVAPCGSPLTGARSDQRRLRGSDRAKA